MAQRLNPSSALRWVFLGLCALVAAQRTYAVAVRKAFTLDEFQWAHAAWEVARGQLPYRDFFEVHFPLTYQYMSLAFRFGDANDPTTILTMRAMMIPALLLMGWGMWRVNEHDGWSWALLAPTIALIGLALFEFGAPEGEVGVLDAAREGADRGLWIPGIADDGGAHVFRERVGERIGDGLADDEALGGDDDHYHGTHVAGTIGALNNGLGVRGVIGSDVSMHIVKVFNASGWGYSSDLASAITTCTNNGADVINMSLGGPGPLDDPLTMAVNELANENVLVVISKKAVTLKMAEMKMKEHPPMKIHDSLFFC